MASESDPIWYLDKVDDDGHDVFGPVKLDNLRDWAMAAKISPLDRISSDGQKTWDRAPMIPGLHMDWLVEVSDDFLYGPTTIGTIQDFIANGEIDSDTWVINCTDGSRSLIRDNPSFEGAPRAPRTPPAELPTTPAVAPEVAADAPQPTYNGPIEMQKRIHELEALVNQQKRALHEWQRRHQALRAKLRGTTGQDL